MNKRLRHHFYPFDFDRSTVSPSGLNTHLLDPTSFYYMTIIHITIYRLVSVAGNESYNKPWLMIRTVHLHFILS